MNKREHCERIQDTVNSTLSGLRDDPWLAQRVIAKAKGEKKVKKKISAALVLVFVWILIAATALAVVTIREAAQMMAQTEQDVGWFVDWPVEKKTTVVAALAEQGYIEKSTEVCRLMEGGMNPEDADRIADELISEFTGRDIEDVSFLVVMQAAWGPFDAWSDADRAWYSALMEDVGVEPGGKTVYVLPTGEVTREQAVRIATNAILEGMDIEESALENYQLIVNFQVPEFAEEGDEQPYWYVMVEAKADSPDNPFSAIELFIHPQTGELLESVEEIRERWASLPQRPDNALYRAIRVYADRAKETDAYSFREWPLALRAEYSQDISPQVQAILASGDLTDLMNCGSPDTEVIAQSTYVYAVPDEAAIPQEEAYAMAQSALMKAYGLPADRFPQYRQVYVYYDVTHTPKWKFFFNPNEIDVQRYGISYDDPILDACYRVEIDAYTGETLLTEEFDFQLGQSNLEYRLKWY